MFSINNVLRKLKNAFLWVTKIWKDNSYIYDGFIAAFEIYFKKNDLDLDLVFDLDHCQ